MRLHRLRRGAAFLIVAAPACLRATEEADARRLAVDPEAYVGRRVAIEAKFSRIDNGRDPWEEQANLKASRMVKFTAAPLGGLKCYAARSRRNVDALAELKRRDRIVLVGAVKRYRTSRKVSVTRRSKATGRWIKTEREERGRVRYGFVVDSIERDGGGR
ncbi:MAG: hypothetical protein GXY35_11730 [Chlamydiae bacterium]|nr:hypothetical protein [Chlamydiota bacterium]